ncbi:MAG: toxin-antitoxin system, antitoxin component, partial [Lachnospiraceae bacterium]|nr:toxin-antitoxin system, antitoxin component [Lachnospiraceae bacterium]
HVGVVRTFNIEFIHNPSDFFNREDLRIIQSMDRIRNASDYDDFYIADKSECAEQVKNAKYLIDKVEIFLKNNGIL